MANNFNDTLSGLFKKVYGDLENLIPDNTKLTKMVPFVNQKKRNGAAYQQAVILKSEHGVTYGGTDADAFTYNDPVDGATKQASILPSEMILRSKVALGALSRSANVSEGAFQNATQHVIQNMLQSMFTKYEAQCFYGGTGLAVVGSVATNTITISTAEFAPAIWVGGEGMKLQAYDATLATLRAGTMQITAVDLVNKTITVDAAATGLVATDVIFEFGAKGKEFIGVHKMISTTSGSIFGIDTSTYSLWRGNTSAVGGALSFAKISNGIAEAVAKGVTGKLTMFVNPGAWSNLLTEQTAQRIFKEGGMVDYSNGAENIMFYSQNGAVEIVSSAFVKEGYAYALDLSCFMRIGSKDVTFEHPLDKGKFIEPLENSHAYQVISYTDSALFCSALGRQILFTGISNS